MDGINPKKLISRQDKYEMSSSKVEKLRKKFRKQGYHIEKPDVVFYRIIQFVDLQNHLILFLKQQFPQHNDWEYLLELPKKGNLFFLKETWTFQRHGIGVCFTGQTTGKIIDVHTSLNQYPKALDAWRLQQYFESQFMATVQCGTRIYDISEEEEIDKYLADLLSRHLIIIVSHQPLLYGLNEEASVGCVLRTIEKGAWDAPYTR